jgi:protoporphyrinogen oxidase
LVLGAGPAGLAAAYRLARNGRSVTVLERGDAVGGLAASFEVAGQRVDHGSHRLHPSCQPELLAVLESLLGGDLQLRRRHGRVRLQGRFIAFPPRPLELLTRLPPRFGAGVALDAVTRPLRRPRTDTFAEVVRAGLGPTMAQGFYDPYVRKIWATSPPDLSGELARRRVGAQSPLDLVRKMVVRDDGTRGRFFYPRRGFGEISERMADAAVDAGAEIRLGAAVDGLTFADDTLTGVRAGTDEWSAAHVFSTVPLTALVRLAGDVVPARAIDATRALEFRALTLVYVVVDRPRYTEFDAHYFPELDVAFSRVSEPKNYRDAGSDDPPDRTVLCAEVPCSVGDTVWESSETDLATMVADGLRAQGLPSVTPADVVVRRVPNAYPVYRVGFEAHFAAADQWAASIANLVTFGRQGLFAHDNTHHAMAMGWAAADALGRGSFDRDRWRLDRERFAAHVVED